METTNGPVNDTSSDLAPYVGEGIPLVLDEEEESTVALPVETNKHIVSNRLR